MLWKSRVLISRQVPVKSSPSDEGEQTDTDLQLSIEWMSICPLLFYLGFCKSLKTHFACTCCGLSFFFSQNVNRHRKLNKLFLDSREYSETPLMSVENVQPYRYWKILHRLIYFVQLLHSESRLGEVGALYMHMYWLWKRVLPLSRCRLQICWGPPLVSLPLSSTKQCVYSLSILLH